MSKREENERLHMKIWLLLFTLYVATVGSLYCSIEQYGNGNTVENTPLRCLDHLRYDISGKAYSDNQSTAWTNEHDFSANFQTHYVLSDCLHKNQALCTEIMLLKNDSANGKNNSYVEVTNTAPNNLPNADNNKNVTQDGATDIKLNSNTHSLEGGNADTQNVENPATVLNSDKSVVESSVLPDKLHSNDLEPFSSIQIPYEDTVKNWCGIPECFGCHDGCCSGNCCEVPACIDGCCDSLACNNCDWNTVIPNGIENISIQTIFN